MKIKIVSFDPALSNLGIALMSLDIDSGTLELEKLKLIQTVSTNVKTVRKNSDDLQRAIQLSKAVQEYCKGRAFAIAEIPTGTQSARGAMSNGIALGVLAGCPIPLIEVSPTEAKLAGPGIKTATKGEMIEWAMSKYPHDTWKMIKRKGKLVPLAANEHLADACAIAEAGILTPQFQQALAMFRAAASENQSRVN